MRNWFKHTIIVATLFCSTKGQADDRWYTTAFGGVNFKRDSKLEVFPDATAESVTFFTQSSPGAIIGFSAGKRMSDSFRVEAEVSYSENKSSLEQDLYVPELDVSSSFTQVNAIGNVLLDVLSNSLINPYVGIGLGGALSKEVAEVAFNHQILLEHSDSSWGMAMQEIAGLRITLSDQSDIGAEYRSTHSLDFKPNSSLAASFRLKF